MSTGLDLVALIDSATTSPPGSLRDLQLLAGAQRASFEEHAVSRQWPHGSSGSAPWPTGCEGPAQDFAKLLDPGQPLRRCAEITHSAEALRRRVEAEAATSQVREWLAALVADIRRGMVVWRQTEAGGCKPRGAPRFRFCRSYGFRAALRSQRASVPHRL